MRKTLIFFFLGVVYLVCSSRSCNEEHSPEARARARLAAARDSVLVSFENDRISDSEQYAYELAAIQKLQDMPHYLHILTDPGAEAVFRKKAADMLRSMFISGESRIELILPVQQEALELNSFLENALQDQYPALTPDFTGIRKAEPLKQVNDTLYSGLLQYTVSQKTGSAPGSMPGKDQPLFIRMHAVRIDKSFGSEKIRVWKVVLGEVKWRM